MSEKSQPLGAHQTSCLILVVEDEFLIAMELEGVLIRAGHKVLGPAATVSKALALLDDRTPDATVLDVNLGGERVTPVAEALEKRRIPFVLASAYTSSDLANEPVLSNAPKVGKPTSALSLLQELGRMLGPRRSDNEHT
jgi:two-component system, response regulator PdtaR